MPVEGQGSVNIHRSMFGCVPRQGKFAKFVLIFMYIKAMAIKDFLYSTILSTFYIFQRTVLLISYMNEISNPIRNFHSTALGKDKGLIYLVKKAETSNPETLYT